MSKPFVFEKPLGMRDILPEIVRKKRTILERIHAEIERWGYEPIETPTMEYLDIVSGVSSTMEKRMFKLLDRSGSTVVLRPDMTAPIARVVGSLLAERPFPIRLAYSGNVFRAQENEAGRNAEFPEVGVELIGEDVPDADAEVIALAVSSLKAADVQPFQLSVGHVGFVNALLAEVVQDAAKEDVLRGHLRQKNDVGYQEAVEEAHFSAAQREILLALLQWRGAETNISAALQAVSTPKAKKAMAEMEQLWDVLALHGVTEHVRVDLSLLNYRDYYTGVLFEGYTQSLGFPICNGGRYDRLLERFGRPAPATGFSLKVDRMMEVSPLAAQPAGGVLITYTERERKRALEMAATLRAEGKRVTLHRLTATSNVNLDGFTEHIQLAKGGESE